MAAYPTGTGRYHVLPVPGDYDGDGSAEPAWYRDADGTWFIEGRAPVVFGTGPTGPPAQDFPDQDFPVPADYDGDSITDLATFNPRTMAWRVRSSADGSESTVIMLRNRGSSFPAPADYDGVGHAQRATSGWEGFDIEGHDLLPLGPLEGNVPAVADHDGDGRADRSYVAAALSGGTTTSPEWRTTGSTETYAVGPPGEPWSPFPLAMTDNLHANVARFVFVGRCLFDATHCPPG